MTNAFLLPDLLTPAEVARALECDSQTLANWRSTGRVLLPFIKVGGLVRYRAEDVAAFLEGRRYEHTGKRVADSSHTPTNHR